MGSYKAAMQMVEKNIDWIIRTQLRQKRRKEESARKGIAMQLPQTKEEYIALVQSARADLPARLLRLALEHGFATRKADGSIVTEYRRLALKNNSSNWGSCSSLKNINLNIRLMLIPEHLRDYIILHELCHLRHPNHGPDFHRLLDRHLDGKEKEFSKEIKNYTWV